MNRTTLGRIASLIGGIALVIAALAFLLSRPEIALIAAAFAVVGLGTWIALIPEEFRDWVTGRQVRYGGNTILVTVLFVGILVIVYAFIVQASISVDMTEQRTWSLRPQTRQVIDERVNRPVHIVGFFSSLNLSAQENIEVLLKQYAEAGNGSLSYEFVDPDASPTMANAYGFRQDGSLFLVQLDEEGDPLMRTAVEVAYPDERSITNALLRVTATGDFKLYFTSGHNEWEFEPMQTQVGADSLSMAYDLLSQLGFQMERINLLTIDAIPEDASAVVVAGPVVAFDDVEVEILREYMQHGGRMLIMTGAPLPFGNLTDDPALLAESAFSQMLWEDFGVRPRDDVIIDPETALQSEFNIVSVESARGHAITERLEGQPVVFSAARSLEFNPDVPEGTTRVELFKTGSTSYGETNLQLLADTMGAEYDGYDEAQDHAGPLSIADAVIVYATDARLVLAGSADFATDTWFEWAGNGAFFFYAIDWLTDYVESIEIPDVREGTATLPLFVTEGSRNLIFAVTVIVIPLSVLGIGMVVWWSRKRQ